jgi:hypothetical protein
MIPGQHVGELLYEYLRDELGPDRRRLVEAHLRTCGRCREDCEEMRNTLALLPAGTSERHAMLSGDYWNRFVDGVDARIDASRAVAPGRRSILRETVEVICGLRLRTAGAIAAGCAAIAVAVVLWSTPTPAPGPVTPTADNAAREPARMANGQLSRYLRRSQTLLVGLSNKKPAGDRTIDLGPERELSRELANETRTIRQTVVDPRSARLVGDLERIFIEVANTGPAAHPQEIETIRGGIREENLLFKVRMAQAGYVPERDVR